MLGSGGSVRSLVPAAVAVALFPRGTDAVGPATCGGTSRLQGPGGPEPASAGSPNSPPSRRSGRVPGQGGVTDGVRWRPWWRGLWIPARGRPGRAFGVGWLLPEVGDRQVEFGEEAAQQ